MSSQACSLKLKLYKVHLLLRECKKGVGGTFRLQLTNPGSRWVKIPGKCWLKKESSVDTSICWCQQETELNLHEKQT